MTVQLSQRERDVLRTLPSQLRPLLAGGAGAETVTARLYSRGYDDDELEREYRALVGDDIATQRLAAMDAFAETLDAGEGRHSRWRIELDEEQAGAWLSAVNDGRLVLGALLGITDEAAWDEGPDDDNPASVLLFYLGWLEEQLVAALARGLP